MDTHQPKPESAPITTLAVWTSFLLPALAWGAHLQFVYAAAQQVCKGQVGVATLSIVSAVCLAAAVGAGVLGCCLWFSAGAKWPSDERSDLVARLRFLSAEGMLSSLLFAIIIAGQWMAVIYLSPCPP